MANVTATGTTYSINVSPSFTNVTVTDNDTGNIVVTGVANAITTVSVTTSNPSINVAPLASVANSAIRLALSGGDGIDYNNTSGVINVDSSVVRTNTGGTFFMNQYYVFNSGTTDFVNEEVQFSSNSNVLLYANTSLRQYQEGVQTPGPTITNGTYPLASGTIIQTEVQANVESITFENIQPGGGATIIFTQDSVGGWTIDTSNTAAWSNWEFVNNETTLQPDVGSQTLLNVLYDGTTYFASVIRNDNPLNTITVNGVVIPLGGSGNVTLDLSGNTTDDLPEGVTNLYYTTDRANTAIRTFDHTVLSQYTFIDTTTFNGQANLNAQTNITANVDVIGDGKNIQFRDSGGSYPLTLSRAGLVGGVGNIDVGGYGRFGGYGLFRGQLRSKSRIIAADEGYIAGYDPTYANNTAPYYPKFIAYNDAVANVWSDMPSIRYNRLTNAWDISNDGSTYANITTGLSLTSTDDLPEGSNNLYYTTDRANTAIVTYFGDAANGPFSINGNLDVAGNINYVNVTDLLVNDQSITLNYGNVLQDAFIYVDRTGLNNSHIKWNETSDQWEIYDGTSTYVIPRSTSDLTEGTNLYFTDARANSAMDAYLTSITANVNSVNGLTGTVVLDTSHIAENGNLYFTTARANSAMDAYLTSITANVDSVNGLTGVVVLDTDDIAEGATNLYFSGKDTDDLPEGTANLWFTTARANSAMDAYLTSITANVDSVNGQTGVVTLDTGDIAENGNLYFTTARANSAMDAYLTSITANVDSVNGQTGVVSLDTDDIAEGVANLYFTSARANSAIDAYVSGGNAITVASGVVSLDNTAVTPGTYGNATHVPQIIIDQQGRITLSTDVAISNSGAGAYGDSNVALFLANNFGSNNIVTTGNITAGSFTGDGSDLTSVRAETIEITIKNADTVQIDKGMPVHATGTAVGGEVEVVLADAGNAELMPAHFIANETLASTGDTGRGILSGRIFNVDTSSFTVGDVIYVGVGGGYANTAPTGEGNLIQNLGVVTEVAVSGQGEVYGAGRAAATPNLNDGNIFIGNASDQSVSAVLDTSIVPENTNLYYTNARVDAEIQANVTGGYGITFNADNSIEVTNTEIQAQANIAIGNNSNIVLTDQDQTITSVKTISDKKLSIISSVINGGKLEIQESEDSVTGPDISVYKSRGNVSTPTQVENGDTIFNFLGYAHNGSSFNLGTQFGMYVDQRYQRSSSNVTTSNNQMLILSSANYYTPSLVVFGNEKTHSFENFIAESDLIAQAALRVGNGDYTSTANITDAVFSIERNDNTANINLPIAFGGLGDAYTTGFGANALLSIAAADDQIVLPVNTDLRDLTPIPNGTAITIQNCEGTLANLNTNVFYTKVNFDFAPFRSFGYGYNLMCYYELYTDSGLTTPALYASYGISPGGYFPGGGGMPAGYYGGIVSGEDVKGQVVFSAVPNEGAGTTAKDYTFTLGASSNDLVMTVDANTIATYYANSQVTFENVKLKEFAETTVALGSTSGDISSSLNAANGTIYSATLTGGVTINSIANAVAGTSMTIILTQGGTGAYTLTSSMKFAGGSKTLSTGVGDIDIISVFYDGTTYYASLTTDYQ